MKYENVPVWVQGYRAWGELAAEKVSPVDSGAASCYVNGVNMNTVNIILF
jgi:hypothetical protein